MLELHGAMNLSSLILNDIEQTLKMKHTQVENTTEEETIIATTIQNSGKYILTQGDFYFEIREYDISMVNELNKYMVKKKINHQIAL